MSKHPKPPAGMNVSLADIIVACHVVFGDEGPNDETYAAKGERIQAALPTTWRALMELCSQANAKYQTSASKAFTPYTVRAAEVKSQFEEATK